MNFRFKYGLNWRSNHILTEAVELVKDVAWYVAAVIVAFAIMFLAVDQEYARAADAEMLLTDCLNGTFRAHYINDHGEYVGVRCTVEEYPIGQVK